MNVMIIDDDENVCQRLKSIIDWIGLGATFVCDARDSETAMELYMLHRPKIIITDINIPVISGLELAQQLQKEDPELCFIVITAYNDFEHIQKAFELQTISLLCKPIKPEEINEALHKCITHIEQLREKRLSVSALQQMLDRNLPEIRQNYVETLLRNKPENRKMVSQKLNQLKLDFNGKYHIVSLITLHIKEKENQNREAILLLLRDMLVENATIYGCNVYAFLDSHIRLNCIISSSQANVDDMIEDSLNKIQEQMDYFGNMTVFAGIGQVVDRIENISDSYNSAQIALKYQGAFGEESIIQYKNMQRTELTVHSQDPVCSHLIHQFRANDLQGLQNTLQKQVTILETNPQESGRMIRNFLLEAITGLVNEAMRLGLEVGNAEALINVYTDILKNENHEQCIQDLLLLAKNWIEQLDVRRASGTTYLVLQAKEYIKNNLHDETLDLDRVSNHVGLSRIYFCKLFHQTAGISFIGYLKNERIELAKRLLLTSGKKVQQISQETGFSSPRYFSYVFKQTVGQTPLEFQKLAKKHMGSEE